MALLAGILLASSTASGRAQTLHVAAVFDSTLPHAVDSVRVRMTAVQWPMFENSPGVWILNAPLRSAFRDSLARWSDSSAARPDSLHPRGRRWIAWSDFDQFVRRDSVATPPAAGSPQSLSWGLDAIHGGVLGDACRLYNACGQGVIGISLDGGGDPSHPDLTIRGGWNAAYQLEGGGGGLLGGSAVGDSTAFGDTGCNGHGFHTTGTMLGHTVGVAPQAETYIVRISFGNGVCQAYLSTLAGGMVWGLNKGARVFNASWAFSSSYLFDLYGQQLHDSGGVICAANGNAATTPVSAIADSPWAQGVSALDGGLHKSGYSNWGPTTDFAAPGDNIYSTMPGGGYGVKSGTSMAAPHCGGTYLAIFSTPKMQQWYQTERTKVVDEATALLKATAQPLAQQPSDSEYYGAGMLRPDRAAAALTLPSPTVPSRPMAIRPGQTDSSAVTSPGQWVSWSAAPWLKVVQRNGYVVVTVAADAPVGATATVRFGQIQ